MKILLLSHILLILIISSFSYKSNRIKTSSIDIKKIISSVSISLSLLLPTNSVLADNARLTDKLKELKDIQKVLDEADQQFEVLPSGVQYREYRSGKGNKLVQKGSTVTVEMTVRCKSFPTGNEPGGVRYYSTKIDTPYDGLTWTIGSGELLEGLEDAMIGMKRGSLRRIEVPSIQVFKARSLNQLPLPIDSDDDGNRRFKNLFKTDASLIFEVLVDKIVDPIPVEN
jgi:hypothetical protein